MEPAAHVPAGDVQPGFEPVAAAFAGNFELGLEHGAAFAAYVDGRPVVDLWGGCADAARSRAWGRDALQAVYSGTKGLAGLCVLILIDRGELALDTRVASLWPEFAAGGKERVTVCDVLTHHAGVPGFTTARVSRADLADYERMVELVAAEPAWWPDGPLPAYHALTFGWLCSELVRRAAGVTLPQFLRTEVAEPLGLDVFIGLPDAERERVNELVPGDYALPSAGGRDRGALTNPPLFELPLLWSEAPIQRAEIAGGNGIATARSMARLYGCLAVGGELDGVRILGEETLALARTRRFEATEAFFGAPFSYGLGFQVESAAGRFAGVQDGFGHDGAGGSVHGAWPSLGTGFSYAMNRMRPEATDVRARRILDALHACVRRHRDDADRHA